jgi:hypothetical protein
VHILFVCLSDGLGIQDTLDEGAVVFAFLNLGWKHWHQNAIRGIPLSSDNRFRPKALCYRELFAVATFLFKQDSSLTARGNSRSMLKTPKGRKIKLSFIVVAIHEFRKAFKSLNFLHNLSFHIFPRY